MRMYNVIRVRDDNGERFKLNDTPMTHTQACTFKSKMTYYPWCRDMLEESKDSKSLKIPKNSI